MESQNQEKQNHQSIDTDVLIETLMEQMAQKLGTLKKEIVDETNKQIQNSSENILQQTLEKLSKPVLDISYHETTRTGEIAINAFTDASGQSISLEHGNMVNTLGLIMDILEKLSIYMEQSSQILAFISEHSYKGRETAEYINKNLLEFEALFKQVNFQKDIKLLKRILPLLEKDSYKNVNTLDHYAKPKHGYPRNEEEMKSSLEKAEEVSRLMAVDRLAAPNQKKSDSEWVLAHSYDFNGGEKKLETMERKAKSKEFNNMVQEKFGHGGGDRHEEKINSKESIISKAKETQNLKIRTKR